MKQVQVLVPDNQVDVIEDLLENFKMQDRAVQIQTRKGDILFEIKVEENESNELLHELKARGVGDVFGEISVVQLSLHLGNVGESQNLEKSAAANLEEILADIESSATLTGTYIMLVILSGALAAFGLIGDSTVIIIGSMIVAPLLGPVALTSIGFLLPQRGILKKGVLSELVGIVLTVLVGWIIGMALIHLFGGLPNGETHEMLSRAAEADPYNIVFAVVSGIAAGVIISRGQGMSIVGVAIAASLAPPAANIGLYLALNKWPEAQIAAALLFINILAINAACSIIFTIYRLPSKAGISKRRSSRAQKINNFITIVIIILFVLLSIFLLLRLPGNPIS